MPQGNALPEGDGTLNTGVRFKTGGIPGWNGRTENADVGGRILGMSDTFVIMMRSGAARFMIIRNFLKC